MATYSSAKIETVPRAGVSGGGNFVERKFTGTEVAAGNLASGSIIRVLRLPAGTQLYDAVIWPSAATTSLTAKVGYLPVDGSAGDDDALITATSIATAVRLGANAIVSPVILTKDSYIVLTTGGATCLAATEITVQLKYDYNPA